MLQAANDDPKLTSGESWICFAVRFASHRILDDNDALYPVQYIVQALALMKDTLPQWSPTKKGITPEQGLRIPLSDPPALILFAVLSAEFIQTAIQLLLTRFLPLTPTDLEKWSLDSEEWTNEEVAESGAWEYDLRVRFPATANGWNLLISALAVCRTRTHRPVSALRGLRPPVHQSSFRRGHAKYGPRLEQFSSCVLMTILNRCPVGGSERHPAGRGHLLRHRQYHSPHQG